jgi:multidrug transporter EmrE-like cation transporter
MSSATVILLAAVLLNALGNVFIKVGMSTVGALNLTQPIKTLMTIFFNPNVVVGIVLYVLALAGYSYTLARLDLSIAYPIMSGLSFTVVFLVSALFLREKVQWVQVAGCFVILLGVWMVSSSLGTAPTTAQLKTAPSRFFNE